MNTSISGILAMAVVIFALPSLASSEVIAPFPQRAPSDAAMSLDCTTPPEAIVSLAITSKYGSDGPRRDTINVEANRTFKKQMKPIRAFSQQVVKRANRYTLRGGIADAQCTLSWLDAWAHGKALSQMDNPNAEFERAQTLAGLSIALLQVALAVRNDARFATAVGSMTALATSTNAFLMPRAIGSRGRGIDMPTGPPSLQQVWQLWLMTEPCLTGLCKRTSAVSAARLFKAHCRWNLSAERKLSNIICLR
nr:hypothetical protein [Rhizobium skierniewicense]